MKIPVMLRGKNAFQLCPNGALLAENMILETCRKMFSFHILVCQSDKYKNSKYLKDMKNVVFFQIIVESMTEKSYIFKKL